MPSPGGIFFIQDTMQKLSIPDLLVIALYLVFLLYIGFQLFRRRPADVSEFLLAGRKLTLPSFVATLVTTWYGGILGVGEFSYKYGISNWLVFGVPYYIAAIIFALLLAKRARRLKLYTIPHQLDTHYGKVASIIGAVFLFVMTVPAAYILMLAVLLKFFFGWSLLTGLIIGAVVSTCYVLIGGFHSVVRTDKLQFAFMFGGFMLILPIAVCQYGGLDFLRANVPAAHFIWHGGNDAPYIFVWYFIALATLVEPSFYQRCFAAKNERVAKNGILLSVLFWLFFDFMTTFTGMYARAILPNLADPVTAYLALAAKVLPPVVRGLFFVGLLATIMSTIDSYSFLAAMTLGRDVIWRLKKDAPEIKVNQYTRWSLIVSALVAIIIAYYAQSIIRIWKDIGSIGTPALLVPLVTSFFDKIRMRKGFVIISMIGSALIAGFWVFSKQIHALDGNYFLGLEPIYPGLGFSLLIFLFDYFHQKINSSK